MPRMGPGLRPRAREGRRLREVRARSRRGLARVGLGEAEVEDLDPAVGRQLDVGGLHIAVDDAFLVGFLERFRGLSRDPERVLDRDRPADARMVAT